MPTAPQMYHILLVVDCALHRRLGEVMVHSGSSYRDTITAMGTIAQDPRTSRVSAFFKAEFPDCNITFQMRVG